ncbi:hypothetical protein C1752_03592 [Acaryochloris thomasi RCC1774]|uniref:Glycosyltransferase 2-like domain-containing protein n=1 Tax=Acaryochloris thomasi RCC1774 TaxID=1764569 RepID=A0A2W1JLV5_9CYAN|nr:glycosyltransferase family 2 protein [Acaryochloris thomasi]PZD72435.1 hypothetical protein C1752_03592 [Acaryochloris thomasi RCC1774]
MSGRMLSPAKELVFIIIPVHNRKEITLACLENLDVTGDLGKFHVVVVDDGSTDGTGVAVRNAFPQVNVLEGHGSLWWTGAIVQGMKYSYEQGAKYFIWLNDDSTILRDTLSSLVDYCQKHPRSIIGSQGFCQNGGLAYGGKKKTLRGYRFIQAPDNSVISCDLLSGNIVCLPREVIDEIGYPDFFRTPHYGGDSLYLIRAHQHKFSIFVDGRYPAVSLPGQSPLYPTNWLSTDNEPNQLIKLMFNPYSGLSWRVWFHINWEAYSFWGLVMFLKKYTSILCITFYRYIRRFSHLC